MVRFNSNISPRRLVAAIGAAALIAGAVHAGHPVQDDDENAGDDNGDNGDLKTATTKFSDN